MDIIATDLLGKRVRVLLNDYHDKINSWRTVVEGVCRAVSRAARTGYQASGMEIWVQVPNDGSWPGALGVCWHDPPLPPGALVMFYLLPGAYEDGKTIAVVPLE